MGEYYMKMSVVNRMIQQIIPHRTCLFQLQFVRYKGHSKFQNIKHIKAARDASLAKLAHRYSNEIAVAVKNNGNEKDPERNKSLARVIKEAYAQGIMKTTIE